MVNWTEEQWAAHQAKVKGRKGARAETPTKQIRAKPKDEEHLEQVALFALAEIFVNQYPVLDMLYAIPNGGHRHKAVAGKLKGEGVKSGVPDVCLPVARRGYHGLYIEMKKVAGGRPSKNQKIWIENLISEGYRAVVCHGAAEAWDEISDYLMI